MDNKQILRKLRHEFSTSSWILLLQYGFMNFAVLLACGLDLLFYLIGSMAAGKGQNVDFLVYFSESLMRNGWGYILAIAFGMATLLIWKKPSFFAKELLARGKKMTPGAFFSLTAIFLGLQALVQVLSVGMEWFLNLFGLSLVDSMSVATDTGSTLSMFLYAALLGPIWEEVLFRGAILRSLQPYGKKFSILASAFLFGMFHGNVIQTPFAFGVGLVLGYVTVEYSVIWAVVLHLINNLLLADVMGRISAILPAGVGDLISIALIWGCFIAAVIVLIVKRKDLIAYFKSGKIHPLCLKGFFTAPGTVVLTIFMAGTILFTLIMPLFA